MYSCTTWACYLNLYEVLPTEWWGETLFRLRISASFTNPDAGLIVLETPHLRY